MHLIKGQTISESVLECYNQILAQGYYQDSRNGGARSLYDVTVEIANPRSRHLSLIERKSNIFQLMAETFWVMAGQDKLDPYLSFFLPRAKNYSDDGRTWAGAYGPRLYAFNHLESMVDLFKRDGLYTRRAFVPIHDPELDSTESIERIYGEGQLGKDRPCNLGVSFYVINGDQFTTKVFQRSGDIVFGTGSINPFEFSFLHELMYNEVKKIHPELKLGPYRWHVTNMHLYDFSKEQVEAAVEVDENYDNVLDENHMPIIGPDVTLWREFFGGIVDILTKQIQGEMWENTTTALSHHFDEYNIVCTGENGRPNILYTYAYLCSMYIAEKTKAYYKSSTQDLPWLYCENYDPELKRAIINSPFRKFGIL